MANVFNVQGVARLSSYLTGTFALLVADQIGLLAQFLVPRWGVYFNGFPIIRPDSVVSFEFKQDNSISDYPVEEGGFQSYNKVQLPKDIRLRVSCGGSEMKRQFFLNSIFAQINTTSLYDIVTPEKVYVGYNFSHCDFKRSAKNGVGLIVVELWFIEIRETATATYQNTQQAGFAGTQGIGNVQSETASDSLQSRVSNTNSANGAQLQ